MYKINVGSFHSISVTFSTDVIQFIYHQVNTVPTSTINHLSIPSATTTTSTTSTTESNKSKSRNPTATPSSGGDGNGGLGVILNEIAAILGLL